MCKFICRWGLQVGRETHQKESVGAGETQRAAQLGAMMQMAAAQVLQQEHDAMQFFMSQQPLALPSSLMPVIPQVRRQEEEEERRR